MKKTGNDYIKPFAKEIFGVENVGFYPYPREELVKQSIFPYFVLDGGAYNLMKDRFGTADGDEILELTLSGKLFEIFKFKGEFGWESSFAFTEGTDFRKKYEWQIWPQRLYFTIPLAHRFLQTGDRKYADAWLTIVKEWDKAHPYQEFDERPYWHTDMTWRDMQVAWRTMSLLHGLFMLEDAPFSKEDWAYLYDFMKLHMNHLYLEAMDRLAKNHAQNHVLQIGVVLLLAVSMFPEFENVEELTKIGLDTVEMNLRNAIYDDGGSDEDSPSYSHFIARLYLEALLVIEKNGYPEIKGLRESVKKQYEWLYQCMTPRGKTLQLSDSYTLDVMQDIEYASRLIDLDFERLQKEIYYPQSHLAIFRKSDMTLFSDAAVYPGPHHHVGAPQLISFYKGQPILVDGGICNYDRWEFYHHLMHFKSHNVVFCEEFDDIMECKVTPEIKRVDLEKGTMEINTVVSHSDGRSYEWTRKLTVTDHKITIEDEATSETELNFKSRFLFKKSYVHFPNQTKQMKGNFTNLKYEDDNIMQLLTDDFMMTLTGEKKLTQELSPVMNDENKLDYAVVAECKEYGKVFKNKTVIEFIDR
ncbi:MAG: heparinase II/III family protein [Clostridia bacterium]|nr:heparinase II/III family protein [Clostridia bacterium]